MGYGSHRSQEMAVDITNKRPTILAIDFASSATDAQPASENTIVLRRSQALDEQATAKPGLQNLGNPRSPREQRLFIAAIVLLLGGQLLSWTVNRPTGALVSLPGAAAAIVFFFRKYTYRQR